MRYDIGTFRFGQDQLALGMKLTNSCCGLLTGSAAKFAVFTPSDTRVLVDAIINTSESRIEYDYSPSDFTLEIGTYTAVGIVVLPGGRMVKSKLVLKFRIVEEDMDFMG